MMHYLGQKSLRAHSDQRKVAEVTVDRLSTLHLQRFEFQQCDVW